MRPAVTRVLALALAGGAASVPAAAQSAAAGVFADPVRLMAGDAFLGENRLFPSPVFHDVDGDGLQDVVVGDLFGHLTVALRQKGSGAPLYGKEARIQAADGKDLKFHNW